MNIGNLRAHLRYREGPRKHAQRRKFSREQYLRIKAVERGVKKRAERAGRKGGLNLTRQI